MAIRVSTVGNGKKSTPAIKVAVAAVALSVAVMLAAIAIVLGFKEEITRKVIGFNPHILLKANPALSNDEYLVSLTPSLIDILDNTPYIDSYALSASTPAILKTDSDFKGVYLKSASEDYLRDFLSEQLIEGSIPDFNASPDAVVISSIAANQLRLHAGDTIPTFFITDRIDVKHLKVSGIYNSHFSSYDDIFVFGALPFIQNVGQIRNDEGTSLNIYIDDFDKLPDYAYDLRLRLDNAFANGLIYRYYDIETTLSSGANFFSWLALLDANVMVILILMTAVALITLISGIMILIVDKRHFIAVMKSLGASQAMIRKIFIWLTIRVAAIGLLIGNVVMLALLIIQEKYHFIPLDADSYYIDFVPVKISVWSVIILNVAILAVTYLMLLLPSRLVGSIKGASS